jgi:hypothetical protein
MVVNINSNSKKGKTARLLVSFYIGAFVLSMAVQPLVSGVLAAKPSSGTIVIIKDTVPDSPQDFEFTATGLNPSTFNLSDGQNRTFNNLASGSYTVTETHFPGYDSITIVCSDVVGPSSSGMTVEIILDPDETVTCTFENELTSSNTSATPTPTPTPSPTVNPTPTPIPTISVSPSPSTSTVPTATPTPTPTVTPTATPTPTTTPTPVPTPTVTPTPTATPTPTPSTTATVTGGASIGGGGCFGCEPYQPPSSLAAQVSAASVTSGGTPSIILADQAGVLGAVSELPATSLSWTDSILISFFSSFIMTGLFMLMIGFGAIPRKLEFYISR